MLLKDWKDKTIGRWVIKDIDYNVVMKEICLEITCIKCLNTKSIKVKNLNKIKELECLECKLTGEWGNNKNEKAEDKSNNSELRLVYEPFKLINNERDRYIVEKLKRVLAYVNKSGNEVCREWLSRPESFEEWAIANDYKPWKVLEKYVKEFEYSPDNCYWKLDNRGVGKVKELINDDNTLSNTVSYVKDLSYNINSASSQLVMLEGLGLELIDSNYIENKGNIADCIRNIKQCLLYLNKCSELLNDIELKMR